MTAEGAGMTVEGAGMTGEGGNDGFAARLPTNSEQLQIAFRLADARGVR